MDLRDVTLREGNQQPGRAYEVDQRVAAGRELDRLGVAYLQAGFPVAGDDDVETVRRLSAEVDADVVGLARALPGDVDAVLEAEADVVEVMAGLSDYQLAHVLDHSAEEMLAGLASAVERAHDGGATVHVTLVDAFRSEPARITAAWDRLAEVELVTLADTVGVRTPTEVATTLDALSDAVDLDRIGVHFHDDLGVGTANALTAIDAGVGAVDASVAGVGERAGNAALEEVVVGAELRDVGTPVPASDRLVPICRAVLEALDEPIPPRKAIIGEGVTTHESGLHTAAMLKEPATFEPYDPARFGGERLLVFGAGSGRRSAAALLERAGLEPTEAAVEAALELLAERGPLGLDEAVETIASDLDAGAAGRD